MLRSQLVLATLTLLAAPTVGAQTPRLLAVQSTQISGGPGELVEIDLATSTGTTLGTIANGSVDSLAWSPDNGALYAGNSTNNALLITDPNGPLNWTTIGFTGSDSLEALAAHPVTGELYGIAYPGSRLVRVDRVNAGITDIGMAPTAVGAGLAFSLDGSALYWADWSAGEIWSVDLATGTGTFLASVNAGSGGGPLGLAVDPRSGDLYATEWFSASDARIVRLEFGTWGQTIFGPFAGYDSFEGLVFVGDDRIGDLYCTPATPNSTGVPAEMAASGRIAVALNDVTLRASSLPPATFAFFLASRVQQRFPNAGGSQGTLCLGHPIGRLLGPGQVVQSSAAGEVAVPIDLTALAQPTGLVSVMPGETWNFQGWYRDVVGGQSTSNFTDGLSIRFL